MAKKIKLNLSSVDEKAATNRLPQQLFLSLLTLTKTLFTNELHNMMCLGFQSGFTPMTKTLIPLLV